MTNTFGTVAEKYNEIITDRCLLGANAYNGNVLGMSTVVWAPATVTTTANISLVSVAIHVVKPDLSRSGAKSVAFSIPGSESVKKKQ